MKNIRILLMLLGCIGYVQALKADISAGKFGVAQVFDVQRNPAFPVANNPFIVSNFQRPFGNGQNQVGQYTIAADQFIKIIDIDPAAGTCNYEINLHNAAGFVSRISSGGDIHGLGIEGFLHISNPGGFGTFVSNSEGFAFGDSLTYTPSTAQATCAQVEAYAATTEPLADGESAGAVNNAQPIPVLGGLELFMMSGLLGMLGFLHGRKGKQS